MEVEFETRSQAGRALRDDAERKLRFALRRLAWFVSRATLRIETTAMASNGLAQRCSIALTTCTGQVLSATALADDASVAVHGAVTQIGRRLRRDWGRTWHTLARKSELGRSADRRER